MGKTLFTGCEMMTQGFSGAERTQTQTPESSNNAWAMKTEIIGKRRLKGRRKKTGFWCELAAFFHGFVRTVLAQQPQSSRQRIEWLWSSMPCRPGGSILDCQSKWTQVIYIRFPLRLIQSQRNTAPYCSLQGTEVCLEPEHKYVLQYLVW